MSLPNGIGSLIQGIPKLTNDNWFQWDFQLRLVLTAAGCHDLVVEGLSEGEKASATQFTRLSVGKTIIGLSVDPSQISHIRDSPDGASAYSTLRSIHEQNSSALRSALRAQLSNVIHDPAAPVLDYYTHVYDIASKLRALGANVDDEAIIDIIITRLRPSYKLIRASLRINPMNTLASVRAALIAGELDVKPPAPTVKSTSDAAHFVRQAPRTTSNAKSRTETRLCYTCGDATHIARDCPKRFKPIAAAAATYIPSQSAGIAFTSPSPSPEPSQFAF